MRHKLIFSRSIAGNTAFLTSDFLSLLISKQNPTQAGVTLSQGLREIAGIGTMGFDKLDDPTVSPTKAKDHEDVAVGWTIMKVNKTRDAAEEACKFLQKEIAAEGRYWDEIVAVQKNGWSISRVPKERHTLGVRFGFSEGWCHTHLLLVSCSHDEQLPPISETTVSLLCEEEMTAQSSSTVAD